MKQHDVVYNRIDSLVNIKLQGDVLNAFVAMARDLVVDEPFDNEDIVQYMALRMQQEADERVFQ